MKRQEWPLRLVLLMKDFGRFSGMLKIKRMVHIYEQCFAERPDAVDEALQRHSRCAHTRAGMGDLRVVREKRFGSEVFAPVHHPRAKSSQPHLLQTNT